MRFFPFKEPRRGQAELMEDVAKVIEEGKHLLAHAPAGIGKTAAVLTPCLEYCLDNHLTLLFLTPKHTQHAIVIETLRAIKRKFRLQLAVVDIIGKQWTCPYRIRELDNQEFQEFCKALKRDERCEYYLNTTRETSRLSEVVSAVERRIMHAEEAAKLCESFRLCPYEVALRAAVNASVLVCDYFHVFSPSVREAFLLKAGKRLESCVIVVDEAHNLPDRVKDLLSVSLSEASLRRAAKEAELLSAHSLFDDLKDFKELLLELAAGMEVGSERYVRREELLEGLERRLAVGCEDFAELLDNFGEEVLRLPNRHRSYCKSIARFLFRWLEEDPAYVRILRRDAQVQLSNLCLDASVATSSIFIRSYASILMSGTLTPTLMYANLLGLELERVVVREYESPFPKENRLVLLVPGLTTRYTRRTEAMYKKYAELLERICEAVPGNLAAFFPAYQVLERVKAHLDEARIGKRILVERKEMKKEERVLLYAELKRLSLAGGALLLAVQAGSFSEGVDYKGKLLSGVVIVGLPLEVPNLETKALIDYYERKFGRGWDYGYIYPAMNKVLQAAGRCIRSETDRGVIVLLDERFKWRNYAKCLPKEMEPKLTMVPEKFISSFFSTGASPKYRSS